MTSKPKMATRYSAMFEDSSHSTMAHPPPPINGCSVRISVGQPIAYRFSLFGAPGRIVCGTRAGLGLRRSENAFFLFVAKTDWDNTVVRRNWKRGTHIWRTPGYWQPLF